MHGDHVPRKYMTWSRISFLIGLQLCGKRDFGTVVFPMNFAKNLRTPFLQNTSERLLLSIEIICQEHLKLNVRATIFWSLTFTF